MSSHPPKEDKENKIASSQKSRKYMNVTVYFLDDSNHVFQIQTKATGQALFEKTCKYINLLEVDYFCLEFEDGKGIKCWLDVLKPLGSQISTLFPTMYFQVKFYSPDPAQLEDELTRYLFGLQIRKDLASGALQCNDNTAAVIISYIVQADLGDHDEKKCLDSTYFSNNKFLPYQDSEIQRKVVENHMKLMGQSPAEADLNLLETSRRCELYGIKMTPAKDHEGVPLNLAVSHLGVLIFQNFTKINTFSWPKIRKLSFKRKKFLIKLHPEGYGYYKDTAEYYFEGRNECKNFWKKCIENHTFFRCSDAKQGMRQKTKIFSRGSSFRYSGRTQKQVTDFVRENCFKRPPFQRSTSLRTASTSSSPSRLLNTFTSAQPLIPVTSQSCGSISDVAREVHPSKILSTSEPTTPHVAQDLIRPINNNCPSTESPTGLISPDFACQQEGFQSPDILGQDTDDNISHDSYHVLEKETIQTNTECMQTNPNNSDNNTANTDNTAQPVTNGNVEDEGKSNFNLKTNKCQSPFKNKTVTDESCTISQTVNFKEELTDDQKQKMPSCHRVRNYCNNICADQVSPTLYARANHCITTEGVDSKAYSHTVDFVLVNQLPSVGNFSYKDDSVEVKSPQQIKLELLQWKSLRSKSLTCSSSNWDGVSGKKDVLKSGKGDPPLSVDFLSDLKDAECSGVSSVAGEKVLLGNRDLSSKENALQMIAANHGTFKRFASLPTNTFSEPRMAIQRSFDEPHYVHDQTYDSICLSESQERNYIAQPQQSSFHFNETKRKDYGYVRKANASEVRYDDEVIDHSNQYAYTTYRFSHIGRPSESLHVKPVDSTNLSHCSVKDS